ncbi:MAG: FtsL-like putative cell division protein [Flavobacteriaceae bacterium]
MNQLLAFLNLEFLIKDDALKNWRMLLFLSFLALVMIASGHSADKKIYTIAKLNTEIKEEKSEFVEIRSNLMRLRMESRVASRLAEKGVGPATAPPIKLKRRD